MGNKSGTVYLVGGGPGDPELLTLKAKKLLEEADAVVFDSLAPREALLYAPDAVKFDAGKRGGRHGNVRQEDIQRLLAALARKYKKIVRLKGGDPLIFGRGGEEALFLASRGIGFEIVPGVTAASGAAASCKIPLTHRDFVSAVEFITAHEALGKKESRIDWKELASGKKTLVFYMGVRALPKVISNLLSRGLSAKVPAAIIQSATTPEEKIVTGDLGNIVRKACISKIEAPSLIVVGEVIRLRERLVKKTPLPLSGRCILVTRARHQASALTAILKKFGARVIEFPLICIEKPRSWGPVDREIEKIDRYDWILFTSANGVEMFFKRLLSKGKDARALGKTKLGAIGPATAAKLLEYRLKADLIPGRFISESLAEDLISAEGLRGKRILLARAEETRKVLREKLEEAGARVKEIALYRVIDSGERGGEIRKKLEDGEMDLVTFTSSSTVKSFVKMAGKKTLAGIRSRVRFASIGPVTSLTLKRYGLSPACEARQYTIDGLARAIRDYFGKRRSDPRRGMRP